MQAWRKLPEGLLAEVIDGKLYLASSPTKYHLLAQRELFIKLTGYVNRHKLGQVYFAPVDVYLPGLETVVIPDIIFVRSGARRAKLVKKGIVGPPDLIIEILSPSTAKKDLELKRQQYERAGVKEYIVVDPESKTTYGLLLQDGTYNQPLELNSKIKVRTLNRTINF